MKANKVINGMRVVIANKSKKGSEYIQGYTGNATVINSTPNDYGLIKVILEVEPGFPYQHNPAYYPVQDLKLRK